MAKARKAAKTPARKTPARKTPARKTPARKTPARKTPKVQLISKAVLAKRGITLAAQKEQRKIARRLATAKTIVSHFKPAKKDRGQIVFLSGKFKQGKVFGAYKGGEQKGRKGILVYVTKTGKKRLVHDTAAKGQYLLKKITEQEPPIKKNLRKSLAAFREKRLVFLGEGTGQVRGKGKAIKRKGSALHFGDESRLVKSLAKSIRSALTAQKSNRQFLVRVSVLVKTPGGLQTVFADIPIARPDHIAIRLAGIENFVRQKVYAFMAKELAFLGFVLAGSANHIRRLEDNKDLDESEWVNSRGEPWFGIGKTRVTIENFSWEIWQQK